MKAIEIRLPTRNLSGDLSAMREWLDRRGFEPSSFDYRCDRSGSHVTVHMSFRVEAEAVECAGRFGGAMAKATH